MTEENTLKNEGLKIYEVGYLLLPTVAEENLVLEISKIRDIIEKNSGIFLNEGIPEMKALTYPMTKAISGKKQKFDTAYFGWVKFEANSDVIDSIKQELEKTENILRLLIIKTVKESLTGATSKAGKFAFDKKEDNKEGKEEKTEDKKGKVDKIEKEIIEDKETQAVSEGDSGVVQEEKEEGKKELDNTIDELVIE